MQDLLSQLPPLQPGEIEKWLASALAVAGIALVLLKISGKRFSDFVTREEHRLFRVAVEGEISSLRDRIDSRHLAVVEKIEALQSTLGTEAESRDARPAPAPGGDRSRPRPPRRTHKEQGHRAVNMGNDQ